MMWNFLVGGLLAGATIVLYDGQPDLRGLWRLAEEAGVTCFGTSAGFHHRLHEGRAWSRRGEADLSALREPRLDRLAACRRRASSGSTST